MCIEMKRPQITGSCHIEHSSKSSTRHLTKHIKVKSDLNRLSRSAAIAPAGGALRQRSFACIRDVQVDMDFELHERIPPKLDELMKPGGIDH